MTTFEKVLELERIYNEHADELTDYEKHKIMGIIIKLARVRLREAVDSVAQEKANEF